nr:MAG TPA: hypothetical protein [Caudoviricetes sp.]
MLTGVTHNPVYCGLEKWHLIWLITISSRSSRGSATPYGFLS